MSDVVAACSGDIDRPPPQGECSSQCASDVPADLGCCVVGVCLGIVDLVSSMLSSENAAAVAFVVVVAAARVVTAVATFVVMVAGGG